MAASWRPTASIANLRRRAELLQQLRNFFQRRDVLEVETPQLAQHTVSDPHLDPLPVDGKGFLQTSPEYAMKRLLAAGSGDIFQLAKAFRADENGSRHNPEFTLLEWYRLGFDHWQLIAEVDELLQDLLATPACQLSDYGDLFQSFLGVDPHTADSDQLQAVAAERLDFQGQSMQRDDWLNLLFAECIEPHLGHQQPQVVTGYPASMAALARLAEDQRGRLVASRFEVYLQGIELANGYHELTDWQQQQQRFEADNRLRVELGKPVRQLDSYLLAAMQQGLPDCAGVALGVDRLLMLALGQSHIDQVIAFPYLSA